MRFFSFIRLLLALALWCPRIFAQPADSLQAVVNDRPITQQQIEKLVGPEEQLLYERYHDRPEIYRREMGRLWEAGSGQLITREVILHEFRTAIKVPESIIEEIVTDSIKQDYPDHIALTKKLELEGTTMDQFRKQYRDRFIVDEMRRKFIPEPIISPLKIENFYVAHRDDFKMEDQVKMRMIFLNRDSTDTNGAVRKRAEELATQLKGGAAFDQLARVYSEGSLRSEGGETGWEDFSVVSKTLAPEVNNLKPGQASGVIEAPEGFYLLLLEDRHLAHYRPLSEVRDQIEKTLSGQEVARLSELWITRLRKKTFIKFF
jgi:peptidyl-prolyl cis-trans isomerase SurA